MPLHDRCSTPLGTHDPETTAGEAHTLTAIIAGIDPEEVESFIVITIATCEECGRRHMLLDKDISVDEAIATLGNAIGVFIMSREGGLM
jgi:hypothetical protein